MERTTRITEAKQILGNYFIGPEELSEISAHMGISLQNNYPEIRYSKKELIEKKDNYLLILGATHMKDGSLLTLKTLRDFFGINPELSEPCFYNQDWYMNENFIENPLENRWYLIRRNIFEESRGKNPEDLMPKYELPKAIICAFTFFSNYFANQGEILWEHDFVWCNDIDCNGDQIYVGKYHDIKGINKSGFSIHRHLKIRNYYGSIDIKV